METNERIDACIYFCYILDLFGELPESVIGEIILSSEPSEFFEIIGNIGFMIEKGLISEKKDNDIKENVYSLLDEGKRIAKDLSSRLSPAVKEKIATEGKNVLSRNSRERSVLCGINYDRAKDRYDVRVRFLNEINGETILDLTLYAPDEKKALEMRERFLSKPTFIITRILNMFLKDDFFMYDI